MTDRDFILWLSGYSDAKPDVIDDKIREKLNERVVDVVRRQIFESATPTIGGKLSDKWAPMPAMRAVGSSMGYVEPAPSAGDVLRATVSAECDRATL